MLIFNYVKNRITIFCNLGTIKSRPSHACNMKIIQEASSPGPLAGKLWEEASLETRPERTKRCGGSGLVSRLGRGQRATKSQRNLDLNYGAYLCPFAPKMR